MFKFFSKKTVLLVCLAITLTGTAITGFSSTDTVRDLQNKPQIVKTVFKDCLGREVTIQANPKRILALTSAAMQALYSINIEPVGKVDDYTITEEGKKLPGVGMSKSINIEAVYSLKPDLILASSRFHANLEKELAQCGAVIFYFDPENIGDIPLIGMSTYFGALLDREELAYKYVLSVFETAEKLKSQLATTNIKTGVVLQATDTITAAQSATSYGSMLSLLGIENIVPDGLPNASKSSFVAFDIEAIIKSNPDIIFIVAPSNNQENNRKLLERYKKIQNGVI